MFAVRLLPGGLPDIRNHSSSLFQCPGKMLLLKEVMDGKIDLNEELIDTLFQCTTCAACKENCRRE